jgi:hypothetical protein
MPFTHSARNLATALLLVFTLFLPLSYTESEGTYPAFVAFGRAMGYQIGEWVYVHAADTQRSDPKAGDSDDFPTAHGPQGDPVRKYNHVRLMRDAQCQANEECSMSDSDDNLRLTTHRNAVFPVDLRLFY